MAFYVVDKGLSRLAVKVFASGMLSALGHNPTLAFRDFDGEARFSKESPDDASVTFRVRPAALEVTGDVKASDRRDIERETRDAVLETEKHPEVVFKSSRISATQMTEDSFRIEASGDLTLHGVSREQTASAQVSFLGDTLRAHGEIPVLQSQYGIQLVKVMGGALKVKDEVKLTFELVARRQEGDEKE